MKYLYTFFLITSFALNLSAQNNCEGKFPVLAEAFRLILDNYHQAAEKKNIIENEYKKLCENNYANSDEIKLTNELIKAIDDYSLRLLSADEFQKLVNEVSGAEHKGIGLPELLSIDIDEKTKELTVISPMPNSPASRAGLKPGDKILSIDGKETKALTLTEAMNLLRKNPGENIHLSIEREKSRIEKVITAETIPEFTEPVTGKNFVSSGKDFAYLWIKGFDSGSSDLVKDFLISDAVKKSEGLIIDLRNNPGGLITESLAVCSYFLGAKKIINLFKGKDTLNTFSSEGEKVYGGKIVVLINKGTASAAELLASGLTYYSAASLIGEHTFGKGLLHNFLALNDKAYLSIPMGKLFTLNNIDILRSGLEPDINFHGNFYNEFDEHVNEDELVKKAAEVLLKN